MSLTEKYPLPRPYICKKDEEGSKRGSLKSKIFLVGLGLEFE